MRDSRLHSVHFALPFFFLALLAPSFGGSSPAGAEEVPISGRVVAPGGDGLGGVEVELQRLEEPWRVLESQLAGRFQPEVAVTVRSRRDGTFRLVAPRPGLWQLVLRHPDYLPAAYPFRPLLAESRLAEVELVPRSRLRLRVVDDDDRPVAGVRVFAGGWGEPWKRLLQDGWWPGLRRTATGEDGWAALPAHPDESLRLTAVAGDRAFAHLLEPTAGPVTVRLDRPLVAARLVDAGGRPMAGVFAGVRYPILALDRTGPDGEVRLPLGGDDVDQLLVFADQGGLFGGPRLGIEPGTEGGPWRVRLPATREARGRVVDAASGEPVLEPWIVSWSGHFRGGEDGTFALRIPVEPQGSIRVVAPGYLARQVELEAWRLAGDERLPVTLVPEVALDGRVVDGDGEGIAGVEVEGEPSTSLGPIPGDLRAAGEPRAKVDAVTGADGRFRLAGVAPEVPYQLRAQRPGFAPATVLVPPVTPGEPPAPVEIEMAPGGRILGVVVDPEERPVAGAEVELRSMEALGPRSARGRGDSRRTTTGAEGRFELADLAPGVYGLTASSPGWSPATVPGIELPTGVDEVELDTVMLEPGARIEGRVTDPEGRPLEGMWVNFRQQEWPGASRPEAANVQTDADGRFELTGLIADLPGHLLVGGGGYMTLSIADQRVDPEEPLRITLEPTATLSGRVVDADGEPVAGAWVQLQRSLGGSSSWSNTGRRTGDDGRFDFNYLEAGRVTLTARDEARLARPRQLELRAGEETPEVTLVLEPASRIVGRVLDPEGEPVAGAAVRVAPPATDALANVLADLNPLRSGDATTDPLGRFRFAGLLPGGYRVSAFHDGFERVAETVELLAGDERRVELLFHERRGGEEVPVAGRVVDPEGRGVAGAVVQLISDRPGVQIHTRAVSGGDGRFELRSPEPEVYALLVEHPGFAPRRSEPFELSAAGTSGLWVELAPAAGVGGWILGLEPAELRRLRVHASSAEVGVRQGFVDADGRYRVPGLAAGVWRLTAHLSGTTRSVSEEITIGTGEQAEVDLTFVAGHQPEDDGRGDGE